MEIRTSFQRVCWTSKVALFVFDDVDLGRVVVAAVAVLSVQSSDVLLLVRFALIRALSYTELGDVDGVDLP